MNNYLVILCICFFVNITSAKQLPPFIHPCKANSEDLNKCIFNVINDIRDELSHGIKALGIPPMNSIEIKKLQFSFGTANSTTIVTFNDLIFNGGENYQLKHVNVDLDKGIFDITMLVPHFQVKSKYEISGKLIFIDIQTGGDMGLNFTNVLMEAKYVSKPFIKDNNKKHLKFDMNTFNTKIDSMSIDFLNAINGNAELVDTLNRAFNENSNLLLEEIQPVVNEAVTGLITSVLNRVFNRYSVDELFPNN